MAIDWDPTTGITGLDWPVLRQGGVRLDHAQRCVAAHVPSTAAETVTAISTYFDRVVGTPTYQLEVYETADNLDTLTTATYAPNEDVTFSTTGGTFQGVSTNTVGNRYTNVDEATASDSDYIELTSPLDSNFTGTWEFRINSTAGLGAGTQIITAVRFKYRLVSTWDAAAAGSPSRTATLYYRTGATDYQLDQQTWTEALATTTYTVETSVNPATQAAWTEADITALDATSSLKFTLNRNGGANTYLRLTWVAVEVDYYNDQRVATATGAVSAAGWATFTLDSSWSKANATNYAVAFRRTGDTGSAAIPTLDSGSAHPGSHATYQPTVTSFGQVSTLGTSDTPVMPVVFTVGGSNGVDCQPYVRLRREEVDTNSTLEQEITTAGSTSTIGWVRLAAGSARAQVPGASLLAKIKARAGGAQQGGTATFGTELVEDAPLTMRSLDTTLASTASLSATTQYYVELTSTAADGEGWVVSVLDSVSPPVSADARGFGGTTDRATVAAAESNNYDVATAWGTVPTAPANFAAAASTSGVGSMTLTWTATALGGSFSRYEIERQEADGTWRTIARISTEATATYSDRRCRRGTAETYRIRVRHTNGTVSLPSSSSSATLTLAGAYFIVLEDSSLDRAAEINYPGITVVRPQDRVESLRYGRDLPAVRKYPRTRGVTLSATIDFTGTAGWVASSDWVADVAQLDEVTLVNDVGERWIVDLSFTEGTVMGAFGTTGDWQQFPIRMVEVSSVPAIDEVA